MLFDQLDEADAAESGWTDLKSPAAGNTVLDRVHQAMILCAANRGEMLKRFLVDHAQVGTSLFDVYELMKLLANENFPLLAVKALQDLGTKL